jgi:hypothetical protein
LGIGALSSKCGKADYFLVIHEYLTRVISLYDFTSKLKKIEDENTKEADIILGNFQKLEEFFLVEDLDKFSKLIFRISELCFDYYEDWDGTIKPMTEAEFYNLVHRYYLQLQEAFPFDLPNRGNAFLNCDEKFD